MILLVVVFLLLSYSFGGEQLSDQERLGQGGRRHPVQPNVAVGTRVGRTNARGRHGLLLGELRHGWQLLCDGRRRWSGRSQESQLRQLVRNHSAKVNGGENQSADPATRMSTTMTLWLPPLLSFRGGDVGLTTTHNSITELMNE
jgi:hypothetical protein